MAARAMEQDVRGLALRAATRQFAKRQRTWFRAEPAITWFDAASEVAPAVEAIVSRLQPGA